MGPLRDTAPARRPGEPRAPARRHAVVLLGLVVLAPWLLGAYVPIEQDQPPGRMKALFVGKILGYTAWPEDTFEHDEQPFRVLVIGPDRERVREHFERDIVRKRKRVQGRLLTVRGLPWAPPPSAAREVPLERQRELRADLVRELTHAHAVMFTAEASVELTRERNDDLLRLLQRRPVLTASDDARFVRAGGMVQFVTLSDMVRFEFSLPPMRSARLGIEPELLRLALRVHR